MRAPVIGLLIVACGCASSPAPATTRPGSAPATGVSEGAAPEQSRADEPAVTDMSLRERQVAGCLADSGECQASTPCEGTAEARICDESKLIAADAAVRIAREHGLPDGVDSPEASLIYDHGHRRLVWSVKNLLYDNSRPNAPRSLHGDKGGDVYTVDAVTGELLAKHRWGVKH